MREKIYDRFRVCDEKIIFDEYGDLLDEELQEKLREKHSLVVPHGSFVAYLEADGIENDFRVQIVGNRKILRWESGFQAENKKKIELEPSYVVVGNIPMVARESLLDEILEIGDRLAETSKEIAPPGMLGPFCLETIVNEDLKFTGFEISARIVAGTNPFVNDSPYNYVLHGKGMSMGKENRP